MKNRWADNQPVLATVAHFTDPQSSELIGLMGIDCLWIDLEHQPISMGDLENMTRAARVGDMDVMARPAKGEFSRMARLIEAGASVIMYPRCESAEEAREIVRYANFPPLGERGFFSPDSPVRLREEGDALESVEQNFLQILKLLGFNGTAVVVVQRHENVIFLSPDPIPSKIQVAVIPT